jgi:acyl-CoA thioesterase I
MMWNRTFRIAALLAGFTAIAPLPAAAGSPACTAPGELTRFDHSIARTSARLADGQPVRIVALGSSSTQGAGASSPAKTYPSRLEAELRERFPETDITVINRGVGGEDAKEMLARLDKGVIAERPDLVLFQVGTNAIVDEQKLAVEAALVRTIIERLKAAGIDVVIVDPQYAPKVIAKPQASAMVRMLETVAQKHHIAVFHRFAIMGHWRQAQNIPFEQFTSRDGLHMNDWSYDCISKLLATALAGEVNRPIVTTTLETRERS